MKQKKKLLNTSERLSYYEKRRVQSWLEFLVWLIVAALVVTLILTTSTGCSTKSTPVFPTCTFRVQTMCHAPAKEIEIPDRELRMKENGLRWINCAEKVVVFMEDAKLCNEQR